MKIVDFRAGVSLIDIDNMRVGKMRFAFQIPTPESELGMRGSRLPRARRRQGCTQVALGLQDINIA